MDKYAHYPNVPSPGYGVADIEDLRPADYVCSYCGGTFPVDKLHQCVEQLDQEWEDYQSPNYVESPKVKRVYEPLPHTPCVMSKQPDYHKFRKVVDASFQASPYLKEFIGKNCHEHVGFAEYRERCNSIVTGVPEVNQFFSYVSEGAKVKESFIIDGMDYDQFPRDKSPPNEQKPQSSMDYLLVHWFEQSFFYFEKFLDDIQRSASVAGVTQAGYCPIYCGNTRLRAQITAKLDPLKYPLVPKPEDAWIYVADVDFSLELAKQVKATWALAWLAHSVVECQGGFAAVNADGTVDIHYLTAGRGFHTSATMRHRIATLANYGVASTCASQLRHSYHPSSAFDKKEMVKPRFDKSGKKIPGGTYPSPWSTCVGVMKLFHHNQEIEFYRPVNKQIPPFKTIHHPWRVMQLENTVAHYNWNLSLFFPRYPGDIAVHWFVQMSKDKVVLCVNTGTSTLYKVDWSGSNSKLTTHGFAILRDGSLLNPMTYGISGKTGISPSPYANEFTIRALNRFGGYRFVRSKRIRYGDNFGEEIEGEDYWSFSANHPNAIVVSGGVYHGPFCRKYSDEVDHSFFYPPLASTPQFDEWATTVGLNDYKAFILKKAI